MDSNHRRHSQQIYSLPHLATLVTTQKLLICEHSLFVKSFVLKSECKGSAFFSFHQIFLHLFSLFSQKTSFFPKKEGLCPYRAPCWMLLYPGCYPGLRASALSGRVGQSVFLPFQGVRSKACFCYFRAEGWSFYSFTFLPFNLYNVVSAMLSRQSSVLVVLEFLDRNKDG